MKPYFGVTCPYFHSPYIDLIYGTSNKSVPEKATA